MLGDLILEIDDQLRQLGEPYIYCGSISLYLNGMTDYITDFSDIDIDFFTVIDELDLIQIPISFICGKPIDKMRKIDGIERRYHKIVFCNREFLISDLDYELETKLRFIEDKNYFYRDKAIMRIKQIQEFINKQNS